MKGYDTARSGAVDRAREMRKHPSDAEKRLWRQLRRCFPEAKFRRQTPVGPYFADFLSFRHRLIVEADGGQHAERAEQDLHRTAYLEREGFTVLRFWNTDILANTEGVLEQISEALTK